jgi:hypothetical protein
MDHSTRSRSQPNSDYFVAAHQPGGHRAGPNRLYRKALDDSMDFSRFASDKASRIPSNFGRSAQLINLYEKQNPSPGSSCMRQRLTRAKANVRRYHGLSMKPHHDEEHPREPSTPAEIKKQADEAFDRFLKNLNRNVVAKDSSKEPVLDE